MAAVATVSPPFAPMDIPDRLHSKAGRGLGLTAVKVKDGSRSDNVRNLVAKDRPMTIAELMQDHHKRCDERFAQAENALRQGQWVAGRRFLEAFGRDLESHFAAEEEILFPAFEQATGMYGGPTQMMTFEHGQMRDLLAQMVAAAATEDDDEFAGAAETLLVLMQQHNAKEQNILYPMCDSALAADVDTLGPELLGRLALEAVPA